MSKPSDPAAFARAAGAGDSRPFPDSAAPDIPPALAAASPGAPGLVVEEADATPIPYDPAEYRWVPVRRKPRTDGWTEEKQRRFIEVLADTGLVGAAARAVGMSRETAYRLRRSDHGAAFARAWDAARHHAGGLIEDIAFDRAIEGFEQEVYNDSGEVISAKRIHDNRLLKYLLSHLKPERYGSLARTGEAPARPIVEAGSSALEESLRAMEPTLPAPAEQLLGADTLEDELILADVADGELPPHLREQRPVRTDAQLKADEFRARDARGAAAWAKADAGHKLTLEEDADLCFHLDPTSNYRRRRPPR